MTDIPTSKRWADFPDFILGITKEIWEDRGIATLHHYYSPDIVVRSPGSVVIGNEQVIGATMTTLVEFPDRQLSPPIAKPQSVVP